MALVGDLKELTLADIIQINCIGRNTARLLVHYPIGDGIFYFQEGEVFHATLAGFTGLEALQEALKFNEGAFRIDASMTSPTRTIFKPWAQLLMDGMRQLDEENSGIMDGFNPNEFNPDQSLAGFNPQEILANPQDFLARHTQNMPVLANKEKEHIGAVINDKFRIDKKIKDGELGTMYLATHLQMEVPVAIKVMYPYMVNDDAATERFRRGAHAAARIHHPNAINVLDFGVSNDIVYMVMEFLNGETLRDRIIKQRRIAATELSKMLKQVCAALEAAHRHEIIHRDIKPENIMFDDSSGEEIIKVLDFGLAKLKSLGNAEGVLTAHGLMLGTHDYMSPELCEGMEIDRRSDIYSLGIVLYEALTGHRPFKDPTPVGMALKHIGTKPDSMRKLCPDISESIDRVVLRALEKNPSDRQQTALMLAQEFEKALSAKSSAITLPRTKSTAVRFEDIVPDNKFATRGIPEISAGELGEAPTKVSFDRFIDPATGQTTKPRIEPKKALSENNRSAPIPTNRSSNANSEIPLPPLPPPYVEPIEPVSNGNSLPKNATTSVSSRKTARFGKQPVPPANSESSPKIDPVSQPNSLASPAIPAKANVISQEVPIYHEMRAVLPPVKSVAKRKSGLFNSNLALFFISLLLVGTIFFSILMVYQYLNIGTEPQSTPKPVSIEMEMIHVPSGDFQMGRNSAKDVPANETPAHPVSVKSFYIGRYEVTNKEYREFVKSTNYRPPVGWNGSEFPAGKETFPITNVSYRDAAAFCAWLSRVNNGSYRLPTEEEWEFAARGSDNRIYPWGNLMDKRLADINGTNSLPVNSELLLADQSPFNVVGMATNVTEWTANPYKAYPGSRSEVEKCNNCRVIRGGNFNSNLRMLVTTFRGGSEETYVDDRIGFRVVKDIQQ